MAVAVAIDDLVPNTRAKNVGKFACCNVTVTVGFPFRVKLNTGLPATCTGDPPADRWLIVTARAARYKQILTGRQVYTVPLCT